MMKRQAGFTLIEVLVVMLVLGILASIAIPSFFNQRDKATDADAKVAVRVAETMAEALATDNDGRYDGPDGVTVANLRALEPTLNGVNLSVPAVAANGFTLRIISDTGNSFDLTRNPGGTKSLTCAPPGSGGCPPSGSWG